jgi:hypothetical protein
MQTINCRAGYRSVYGEATKWATEASVFKASPPITRWRGRISDQKRRGFTLLAVEHD